LTIACHGRKRGHENMLRLAKSPYVLKVFNYDENSDSYLMEKCDCNVYDYLENNPFKDDKLILQVIEELLLGMKDVHEAGIIHRDLHLGNILIKEGHVVLSDFGLSKDTMINHSLKSTSTPKNSHYFIDPIGLHDFTALDKLSDIYSIGKIIDYITGESELNKKLSFVISKATERNRTKRYAAVDELIQDVNSSVKEISEEEKIKNIEENLQRGEISKDVEEFVMRLMRQEQLSNYIVRKQLYTF
jgi:serine/threonine protein kinase